MTSALHIHGEIRLSAQETVPDIWVIDGTVSMTEPASNTEVQTIEGWALPGLVDAHSHIGLGPHGAVSAAESQEQAITDRDAGTLLIRDAGSPSDTRWVDDRKDLPKIIRAGKHIARTRRYTPNFAEEIEPDQLAEVMARQARAGDGWVKLVGDWIDRGTGDLSPCWPLDALKEGMAAAHEHGARVTAHCFASCSLPDLVAAGIDCIEHATGLTEDLIPSFVQHDVAIVPTLVNIRQFPALAEPAAGKYPAYQQHMIRLWKDRYRTVGAARDAGVPVYVGTDAGAVLPHGLIAQEVDELTRAGFSPMDAIGAATWDARAWLGRPGLAEGQDADLVVYPADPVRDVTVMRYPRAVVLRGVSH